MQMQVEDMGTEISGIYHEQYEIENRFVDGDFLKRIFNSPSTEHFINLIMMLQENANKMNALVNNFNKLDSPVKKSFESVLNKKIVQALQSFTKLENGMNFQLKEQGLILNFIHKKMIQQGHFQVNSELLDQIQAILWHFQKFSNLIALMKIIPDLNKEQLKNICRTLHTIYQTITTNQKLQEQETSINHTAIIQSYNNLDQQKQLIMQVELIRCLSSTNFQIKQTILQQKVLPKLLQKPYKNLLYHLLKKPSFNFMAEISQKLLAAQIVDQSLPLKFSINCQQIHPELRTQQTVQQIFKVCQFSELHKHLKIVNLLTKSTIQQSVWIAEWNFNMLLSLEQKIRKQQTQFSTDIFYSLIQLMKKCLFIYHSQNNTKIGIAMVENQSNIIDETNNTVTLYNCRVFQLMSKYMGHFILQADEINLYDLITENFLMDLLNMFQKELDKRNNLKYKQISKAFQQLFCFIAYIYYRSDFQTITSIENPISKKMLNLMLDLNEFPFQWRSLRNTKAIIDRWGESVSENSDEFRIIIRKFFKAYFFPQVQVTSKSNSSVFNPIFISRTYNKIFGAELLIVLDNIVQQLINLPVDLQPNSELAIEKDLLLSKMGLFLPSKMKIREMGRIVQKLSIVYRNFAHVLPTIYSFREWIIQMLPKSCPTDNILELLKKSQQSFIALQQKIPNCKVSHILHRSQHWPQFLKSQLQFYLHNSLLLLNNLQLKQSSSTHQLPQEFWQQFVTHIVNQQQQLCNMMNKISIYTKTHTTEIQNIIVQNCLTTNHSIYTIIHKTLLNSKMILRNYVCNCSNLYPNRLITSKQQYWLTQAIGHNIKQLVDNWQQNSKDIVTNHLLISMYNDILGYSAVSTNISHLQNKQIISIVPHRDNYRNQQQQQHRNPLQRGQYFDCNVIISFYQQIRPFLKTIINTMLSTHLQKGQNGRFIRSNQLADLTFNIQRIQQWKNNHLQVQNQIFLKNCLFTPCNLTPVSSSIPNCYFNGKFEKQPKQEYILAVYWDQFQTMVQELPIESILRLDCTILKDFLQIIRNKSKKIVQMKNNRYEGRYRGNRQQRGYEQAFRQMRLMDIPQQIIQISLDNVEQPDPQLALEWVQRNQHQLQDIIHQRTVEKSKMEQKNSKNVDISGKKEKLTEINYKQFIEKVQKGMKILVKSLNQQIFSKNSRKVLELLFILLSSFHSEDFRSKQYTNFAKKIFKNLQEKTYQNDQRIMRIMLQILSTTIKSEERIIQQFYSKAMHFKLLEIAQKGHKQIKKIEQVILYEQQLLEKSKQLIIEEQSQQKSIAQQQKITNLKKKKQEEIQMIKQILAIIETVLPSEKVKFPPSFTNYLHHLINILNQLQINCSSQSSIVYKCLLIGDQMLISKIFKFVAVSIAQNKLGQQFFELLILLMQSDEQFSKINYEFCIKNVILESCKKQIQKANTNLLEIDSKVFSISFQRESKNPKFYQLCRKLLLKKSNKRKFFYYDMLQHPLYCCDQQKDNQFLTYYPKKRIRHIIDSLLHLIMVGKNITQQQLSKYLIIVHKLLDNYKILIPYLLLYHQKFLTWLIQCKCSVIPIKEKFQFVIFLCMRNGLHTPLLNKNQKMLTQSFGDFICAKVIEHYMGKYVKINQDIKQYNVSYWKTDILLLIYLLPLRRFNQIARLKSTNFGFSLQQLLQQQIIQPEIDPLIHELLNECLYLLYKKTLLDRLRGKYELLSQEQNISQKQFLHMSLYYHETHKQDSQSDIPGALRIQLRRRNNSANFIHEIMEEGSVDEQDEQEQQRLMDLRHLVRMRIDPQESVTRNTQALFRPIIRPMQQHNQQQLQMDQNRDKIQGKKLYLQKKCQTQQQQTNMQSLEEIMTKYIKFQVNCKDQIQAEQNQQLKGLNQPIVMQKVPKCKIIITQTKCYTNVINTMNKMLVFLDRLHNLGQLMDPKCDQFKQISKQSSNISRNLSQRFAIRGGGGDNFRHEIMRQIHRIMVQRHRDEDQVRVRPINVANLLAQLKEVPEKIDKQVASKDKKIEENQMVEEIIEKKEQQKKVIVQQKQKLIQEKQIVKHNVVEQALIAEQEDILPIQQPRLVNQEAIEASQNARVTSEQTNIEVHNQEKELVNNQNEISIEKNQQKEQNITNKIQQEEQKPRQKQQQVNLNQQKNQQMIEQPILVDQNREILTMFGLPQSFLRDAGIDVQLFDQLPQELQIDEITRVMAQQPQQVHQQQQNPLQNPDEQTTRVQRMSDPQSENMAFVASLDQQLRAQVLLQATPQFLLSLPPEMRAEAENYRQRQINQMIEQQQIEEQQQYYKSKPKQQNYKHPKLDIEQFQKYPEVVIQSIIKGLLIKIPNFTLNSSYRLLFQNKQTRNKILSSMISLINTDKLTLTICKYNNLQQRWSYEHQLHHGNKLLVSFLHLLYQSIKLCPYQDYDFLMENINQQQCISMKQIYQKYGQNYCHFYYLLDLSLQSHEKLSVQLIKRAKTLPKYLICRIMCCMRKDSISSEFLQHLQVLDQTSNQQQIKQMFQQHFPYEKPAKIQTLAKILKYNFSHVSYLKQTHQLALQTYTGSYNQFLNQIYHIYTLQDIKGMQQMLIKYKSINYQVIKYLYSKGRILEKQPIGKILKFPQLLDFQTKRYIFRKHPKIQKVSRHRLQIQVNRTNIFQQSYNQLMSKTPKQLQGRIMVSFIDEPGYDAGGVARQWFLCLSREIFNPNYALFQPSSSGNTYQPNPKSHINPDHLTYFKFIGRFVAKALCQNQLIDAYFTHAFYKMILNQQLQFQDLQQQDYQFYKSMKWLKQNPIEPNIYTFSYLYDNFGKIVMKELKTNGKDIEVNEDNKMQFIEKYCLSKMRDDFSTQIHHFLQGFHEIIPQECIQFFQAKELQLLISGLPQINLQDLMNNVDYSGYTVKDEIIKWFWQIVSGFNQQNLARLIQFITGTSKIPMQGFKQLQGMNGIQKISIHKDPCVHQLPKSHTCFNQLDLPNYSTKAILQDKLKITLSWGSQGFGFM